MAGRIREKSIAEVREKARIEDIVGQYVTLRNAGGGAQKGLCPFHDEKSPSFNVNSSRGFFHCFGCGEGGDVFTFLMKIDALSFSEAVERLADKYGVVLERDDDGGAQEKRGPGRGKLIEAHKLAQEFYAEQLTTPEAIAARQFLAERSFDRDVAERFGLGYAPRGRDNLYRHLRGRGFTDEELVTAGLVGRGGGGGHYDRFEGRLLWPIRDGSRDVIGFGARKLYEDDRLPGKYVNTSETPIYKKNQVLYGIDLARDGIRKTGQAVVVEGYTDVMACHLAGVTTAVASCGTAFTPEHGKVLRRFIADFKGSTGEVIFAFDGDAAGQNAAMKVFEGDQEFVSQTYVVIAPDGLDPCDLRIKRGDDAVRDLVAHRQPLYRFVLGNVIAKYDLDRADGRVDALRDGARLVSSVRDKSKVDAFARELARMVGTDPAEALAEVRRAGARSPADSSRTTPTRHERDRVVTNDAESAEAEPPWPDPRDRRYDVEREVLKLVLQHPTVNGRTTSEVGPDDFTHPALRGVWDAVAKCGGVVAGVGDRDWVAKVNDAATDPRVKRAISALAVEPIPSSKEPDDAYVLAALVRLLELTCQRRIDEVKSRLQRTDPVEQPDAYRALFGELANLEQRRRSLRDRLA